MPPTPSTHLLPSLSFLTLQHFAPQSLENAAVRIELTRLRGLRHLIPPLRPLLATTVRIELTRLRGLRPYYLSYCSYNFNVRIELTRLRGLRPYYLSFCSYNFNVRIELTRLRGLRRAVPNLSKITGFV